MTETNSSLKVGEALILLPEKVVLGHRKSAEHLLNSGFQGVELRRELLSRILTRNVLVSVGDEFLGEGDFASNLKAEEVFDAINKVVKEHLDLGGDNGDNPLRLRVGRDLAVALNAPSLESKEIKVGRDLHEYVKTLIDLAESVQEFKRFKECEAGLEDSGVEKVKGECIDSLEELKLAVQQIKEAQMNLRDKAFHIPHDCRVSVVESMVDIDSGASIHKNDARNIAEMVVFGEALSRGKDIWCSSTPEQSAADWLAAQEEVDVASAKPAPAPAPTPVEGEISRGSRPLNR